MAAFVLLLLLPFKHIPLQTPSFVSFNFQVNAGGTVDLQWSASNDVASIRFEIERSRDKTAWEKIGEITAGSMQHYAFTDNQPYDGINCYRIKRINNAGNYVYTPVKAVHISKAALLYIWPDPVKDILHIRCGYRSGSVEVIDASGKILQELTITAFTTNISVLQLKGGVYFLRVKDNNNKQTVQKFIKE
ncbi:hypothetical protein A3860_23045 [Niastella vici]|uniref:Secretion system C-terminal sorting domain-containing protein n=2 Tax=Niastella vici TaxID=1703345 RepID=A0A1V9FZW9_9BACT|nr:hypothetical protein A3860_23045 [Niastella vici]